MPRLYSVQHPRVLLLNVVFQYLGAASKMHAIPTNGCETIYESTCKNSEPYQDMKFLVSTQLGEQSTT